MARALFWSWLRSFWHDTTMPVGRWVMRTAESVTLTCWPPAPDERYVSMRRSFSSIFDLVGQVLEERHDVDDANDVWRRAWESNGEMRHQPVHALLRRTAARTRSGP